MNAAQTYRQDTQADGARQDIKPGAVKAKGACLVLRGGFHQKQPGIMIESIPRLAGSRAKIDQPVGG